jgi:hypothetical protein
VAYVRTVKTASGAWAVQIVHSSRHGSRSIEHVGSAHDDAEWAALKAAACERLAAGQGQLGLDAAGRAAGFGPLEIVSSRIGPLWEALSSAYVRLGSGHAAPAGAPGVCLGPHHHRTAAAGRPGPARRRRAVRLATLPAHEADRDCATGAVWVPGTRSCRATCTYSWTSTYSCMRPRVDPVGAAGRSVRGRGSGGGVGGGRGAESPVGCQKSGLGR